MRFGAPLCVLAALAATASGPLHTELKESDPAADTVLDVSPTAVTLTYTTAVQLALSSVNVRRAGMDGAAVAAGKLAHPGEDRREVLVLPLSERLGGGTYTVSWTTAGPDGHKLSGDFGFRVEPPASAEAGDPPGTDAAEADPATPPMAVTTPSTGAAQSGDGSQSGVGGGVRNIGTGMGFFFYLGIVGVLGGVAFRSLVLGRCARGGASREWIDSATNAAWAFLLMPGGFLIATVFLRLWHRTNTFFPDDVAGNVLTVVRGTPWAAGWWLHLVGAVLVTGGLLFISKERVRPISWKIITVGALLLPVVPVLSGHGWSDGPRAVSAVATYLHVAAAGGWMGALACLLWVNARLTDEPGNGADASPDTPGLAEMVSAFSRVAQVAVAVLLVTGALKIWMHIDAAPQLWTTPWGRSLLVKVGVVAGVLALGFYNWRFVRPALANGTRSGGLGRPALVELLLGAGAVAVTSYLVAQPLR